MPYLSVLLSMTNWIWVYPPFRGYQLCHSLTLQDVPLEPSHQWDPIHNCVIISWIWLLGCHIWSLQHHDEENTFNLIPTKVQRKKVIWSKVGSMNHWEFQVFSSGRQLPGRSLSPWGSHLRVEITNNKLTDIHAIMRRDRVNGSLGNGIPTGNAMLRLQMSLHTDVVFYTKNNPLPPLSYIYTWVCLDSYFTFSIAYSTAVSEFLSLRV